MGRRDVRGDDRDEPIVRRDGGGGNALVWVLVAGAVVGTLCVGLAGAGFYLMRAGPVQKPPVVEPAVTKPATVSRDEMRKQLAGKTMEEVRGILGKPDHTGETPAGDRWSYFRKTHDPASGTVDSSMHIYFRDGRVSEVNF